EKKTIGRGKRGNIFNPPYLNRMGGEVINNSYYSQDVHGPYELHDIGSLELEEGAPSAIANSPTLLLARSTPATIMPSLFPPGTRAPTRSLSRFISATVARSIPPNTSSSS